MKRCMFTIIGLILFSTGLLYAQNQVAITLVFTDSPVNQNYRMTVTNNNPGGSGWKINVVHVLFTTAGVLQSTSAPAGWTVATDVPWDAIPAGLKCSATGAARLDPGETGIFEFRTTAPAQINDFDVRVDVTNNGTTNTYVQRVSVQPTIDVPRDVATAQSMQVATTLGGGLLTTTIMDYTFDFEHVPITEFDLRAQNPSQSLVDRLLYPPSPILEPPHLEHFFNGRVTRSVNADGFPPGQYWRICFEGGEWCNGALNIRELRWTRDTRVEEKPVFGWRFDPSISIPNGRQLALNITNFDTERPLIVQNLRLHLRGSQYLPCGPVLERWIDQFPFDVQISTLTVPPNGQATIPLNIPVGVPTKRFFYGAMELRTGSDPLPTRVFFEQEEIVDLPLVTGILSSEVGGLSRLVQVEVRDPNTGDATLFNLLSNAQGRWQVPLPSNVATIPNLYRPIWNVLVKPRGALRKLFPDVLLIGGDPIDPYLRQEMILGDANDDNRIDDADLAQIIFDFGETGNRRGDVTGDGIVNDLDLAAAVFNFGMRGD